MCSDINDIYLPWEKLLFGQLPFLKIPLYIIYSKAYISLFVLLRLLQFAEYCIQVHFRHSTLANGFAQIQLC